MDGRTDGPREGRQEQRPANILLACVCVCKYIVGLYNHQEGLNGLCTRTGDCVGAPV